MRCDSPRRLLRLRSLRFCVCVCICTIVWSAFEIVVPAPVRRALGLGWHVVTEPADFCASVLRAGPRRSYAPAYARTPDTGRSARAHTRQERPRSADTVCFGGVSCGVRWMRLGGWPGREGRTERCRPGRGVGGGALGFPFGRQLAQQTYVRSPYRRGGRRDPALKNSDPLIFSGNLVYPAILDAKSAYVWRGVVILMFGQSRLHTKHNSGNLFGTKCRAIDNGGAILRAYAHRHARPLKPEDFVPRR
ncbi:hypothetical protein C8Q78DRAFT_368065 [Trametes maxima]|nr:hypothetical protein C8Q78DRAFT_368065 [Trametes maxima]